MNGSDEIVFGRNPDQTNHTFRHTDALGLHRSDVIDAIRNDLRSYLPLQSPPPNSSPFIGRVIVGGIELRYHAYPISQGLVNVGRITRP
jgi:hypothetical protein